MHGLFISSPPYQSPSENRYLKIQLGRAILESGDLNYLERIKFKWNSCLALAEDRIAKGGVWKKRYEALTGITASTLARQAELIQVIRRGRMWALRQTDIKPKGETVNDVYELKENGEIFGYLKVGARGNPSFGKMERLAWGVADWLGFEESFAPTEIAQFSTVNADEESGSTRISVWKDGELEFKEVSGVESLCGSVQVAQKGMALYDVAEKERLSKTEVLEGILASVVLGMSDAHRTNIIITPEGKIKFYDNTSTLRHSNSFIKRSKTCTRAAYRCALLDLPASKTLLTIEEISALKKRVGELKRKIDSLEKVYFESFMVKSLLKSFRPGWMDKEAMMAAMKERIDAIEQGLSKGVIKTARDLVFCAYPDYKLVFALTLAHLHLHRHLNGFKYWVDHLHHDQGYFSMEDLLKNRINLRQVIEWCESVVQLEDLIVKIKTGIDDGSLKNRDEATYEEVWRRISGRAVVDMKDTVVIYK